MANDINNIMQFPQARILVFAKAPIPGRCKTRLIPSLGEQGAADLHAQLVKRTLTTATQASLCPVELWCAEDLEHPFFRECQTNFPITLKRQEGADLGERMANAFNETLKEASQVILIGTDCPALTVKDLEDALSVLMKNYDCVLKPADDGGYVLIGLNTVNKTIFQKIHWGSETVLHNTRKRLHTIGWRWHELTSTWDLDRPTDLEKLKQLDGKLITNQTTEIK